MVCSPPLPTKDSSSRRKKQKSSISRACHFACASRQCCSLTSRVGSSCAQGIHGLSASCDSRAAAFTMGPRPARVARSRSRGVSRVSGLSRSSAWRMTPTRLLEKLRRVHVLHVVDAFQRIEELLHLHGVVAAEL